MAGIIEGESPDTVRFPPIPAAALGGACPAGTDTHVLGPSLTVCEQHPIATGAQLVESLAGGFDYGALPATPIPIVGGVADPVTIIDVNGAAPPNPGDPLAGLTPDGSSDLTITWSCDGTSTPGSGCPQGAAGFLDFVGLLVTTSTNPFSQFATTADYGDARCTEQVGAGTVTLRRAAITQILGGQTGGSILIALVRLHANVASTKGHNVFLTAGKGSFVLIAR
jgi:hypothetical protein